MQVEDLKAIVDDALDPILVTDDLGGIVYANRAAARMLDVEEGQLASQSVADLLWDRSSGGTAPSQILRLHTGPSGPLAMRRRDGSRVLVSCRTVSSFPGPTSRDGEGASDRRQNRSRLHLSILRDVTAESVWGTRDESRDRDRLGLLQKAVEAASCGITICEAGEDQQLIYANPAFEAMTGYSLHELVGRNLRFLQGDDREQEGRRALRTGIDTPCTVHTRLRNYRKNGHRFLHQFRMDPVFGPDGRLAYFFGIHDDVTEREAAREDFVDRAKVVQAGRLAAVGELAVGVSHEVKNPLMMMTGLLELALEGLERGDADAATRDIQEALRASKRITGVLDRLQEFAHASTSDPEAVPVAALLDRTRRLLDERLRLAGIDLSVDVPDEAIVRGHSASLGQVFLHLLLNAREALGRQGGWIRVEASDVGEDHVGLLVQDSGPGVPEALRERIFDPYFSTKPDSSGTGLGLAICQEVLRAHGGDLFYEEVAGVGATFRLSLPRYTASIEAPVDPT